MSSKRKVKSLRSEKENPDAPGAEESPPRNTENEVEIPGVHRLGAADMESHFGKDGERNTAAKNKGPSKSSNSTETKLSGNIPRYADIYLPIEKRLWRKVQVAAAKKSIDPSRFVEMALEVVLNSEE